MATSSCLIFCSHLAFGYCIFLILPLPPWLHLPGSFNSHSTHSATTFKEPFLFLNALLCRAAAALYQGLSPLHSCLRSLLSSPGLRFSCPCQMHVSICICSHHIYFSIIWLHLPYCPSWNWLWLSPHISPLSFQTLESSLNGHNGEEISDWVSSILSWKCQ